MTLSLDNFLSDCTAALAESSTERAIREIVARAVSEPGAIAEVLQPSDRGGIDRLHVSDELTVLNVLWAPYMTMKPHNHNMWAVIGVYSGREDNIFWRRCDAENGAGIEATRARSMGPRDVQPLGRSVIHSVTNPTTKLTGAIHIYGGDFFARERSEWDPETLTEQPYDIEANMALFERANVALSN